MSQIKLATLPAMSFILMSKEGEYHLPLKQSLKTTLSKVTQFHTTLEPHRRIKTEHHKKTTGYQRYFAFIHGSLSNPCTHPIHQPTHQPTNPPTQRPPIIALFKEGATPSPPTSPLPTAFLFRLSTSRTSASKYAGMEVMAGRGP